MIINKKINNCAVIVFHKNITKIYDKKWINKCIESILAQTNVKFDIFEVNYGNDSYSVFEDFKLQLANMNLGYFFYKINLNNHIEAMIYLLNKTFSSKYKYDYVFNTNLDDYYNPNRFKEQILFLVSNPDCLICSSMWEYIDSNDNLLKIYNSSDIKCTISPDNKQILYEDIVKRFEKNKNVINHSGVCFTRKLWLSMDENLNLFRYRNDKPFEDMSLWIRIINSGYKVGIINQNLISYRIHQNQITQNKNNPNMSKYMDLDFNFKPDTAKRRIGICFIYNDTKSNINILKQYLKSLNQYFIPDTNIKKILYIQTNNQNEIIDLLNKYNLQIECYFNPIDSDNNFNDLNWIKIFYPKTELDTDLLYWLPINNTINQIISIEQISNQKNKPFIYICNKTINIFGGLTHEFLKFINKKISIEDFARKFNEKIIN